MIEFFSKERDKELNSQIDNSREGFDFTSTRLYIDELLSTPYDVFLEYIKNKDDLPFVLSSDIPQFSSVGSATTRLCTLLASQPHNGFNFEEIGRLLQPGRTESIGANRKYGENHIKTAELLGLAFSIDKKYYLSAIGHVFPTLPIIQQDQLLSRMVLRSPLVFNILHKILNGEQVEIADEISFLSESTVKRRKNNVLIICNLIGLNKEISVQKYLKNIN